MRKISTYSSMFEGKEEQNKKIEEFNRALNSPEGKDFQRWFYINPVRTGRAYISKKNEIKGIGIPSRSYFDKSPNSEEWYFEFSSSSGTYGTTYDKNLRSLLREFMVTAVRKSRPSSITEKQIKEFFSKESNFPIGKFPDPEKIYSSITKESGFITDFSFLMELPIIKRISDLGVKVYTSENSGLTSVFIDFKSYDNPKNILENIFGKEYYDSLKEVIKNTPDRSEFNFYNWDIIFFEELRLFQINPKTKPGKSVYQGRNQTELRLGFDSKKKIEKYAEESLKLKRPNMTALFKKGWNDRIYIRPLEELIIKTIFGEPIGDLKKKSEERIEEILLDLIGPHIEKNPLDLYILDGIPNLKKKAMEKYRIEKDFSKLGRVLGKGFL